MHRPTGAPPATIPMSELETGLAFSPRDFLTSLVLQGLLDQGDRDGFVAQRADRLRDYSSAERLGQALVAANLLTPYQVDRLLTGKTHGLVLGSYRVLKELGKGGMGVVYLAEHRLMKRRAAIKVLPVDEDCHLTVRQRFLDEMRLLAELRHPNVVQAIDAGEMPGQGGDAPLLYLVTELVEGGDLEKHVLRRGLGGVAEACDWVRQAAAGLQAAHDRHLVHRDIKPSNLLRTASGQVKLVDFGLARQFSSRLTDPRALLGSVDFMPPEQTHDPSGVGKEADVYALGATLFWLLTGECPYPHNPSIAKALRAIQEQEPRRLRALRSDVPPALDALMQQMLARNPALRPASPLAVMNALAPFACEAQPLVAAPSRALAGGRGGKPEPAKSRVLVIHDEARARQQHRLFLEHLGCDCAEASDGVSALAALDRETYDLVLLDSSRPDLEHGDLCRRFRERRGNSTLQVVVVTALADGMPEGADDCLVKPFGPRQLAARVRRALEVKSLQDRAARLGEQVAGLERQLEQTVQRHAADLRESHNALLFTVARIAEERDGETPGHLKRLQAYTRVLAQEAARFPPWQGLVDERFLEQLERCVPLHDIGKIGLPDDIIMKPASLSRTEREHLQTHVLLGDDILASLAREHGTALDFLGMARAIVRSHHERWDGKGYPDRLLGEAIPPAARLVAVADVYDTLRRMRLYKPAIPHAAALRVILERSAGQFDPSLLHALERCHRELERIYGEIEE
jgi:response regulator RpfG family c-di-GMP phosphodiesterase/tRNA A-37 threonylcarbamoyl transferase component Bud32